MKTASPIKLYREKQDPPLTQDQLAGQLRVARTTIARWETGARKVDDDLVPWVSKKTGIPPGVLRPDLAAMFRRPPPTKSRERAGAA